MSALVVSGFGGTPQTFLPGLFYGSISSDRTAEGKKRDCQPDFDNV